jgi:uncharacterized oxidoreductase
VRAGRLEATSEAEIEAMVTVDLLAPILLTRAALPALRASGDAVVVNVTSAIALMGAPFYTTYAAVKGGLARFGEALRRELKGEGVHFMTIYPGATETPMMKTNPAGPELGFSREPASAVAAAIVEGIETGAFEVVNLDDFVNLRRWFDCIHDRPGTRRAYAKGEPFSAQPAVTEDRKKLLFGQTAASVIKA